MDADGLRIAFVAQDFPPEVGGTHVYNYEYARRLCARGHQLCVVTFARAPGPIPADAAHAFPVRRVPCQRRARSIDPNTTLDALADWRPDVTFVSGGSGALAGIVRASARRGPVVVSVHDLRDKGRGRGRLGRWRVRRRYGFDRAARITANSEHTRSVLCRLGVPGDRVSVVHPGVHTAHFAPDPEAGARLRRELDLEKQRILLTVARLAPNKGHLRVVEALAELRRDFPDLVYLVVGSGEAGGDIARRAAELGVADAVRLAGRVPDPRPYYNACDVFVMPSLPTGRRTKAGEGFGMAYAEAGACGAPAVASLSGGGAEVVLDGETGRLVDPRAPGALRDALAQLLADPEGARRMGQRARARVGRFDWEAGTTALSDVLARAARE